MSRVRTRKNPPDCFACMDRGVIWVPHKNPDGLQVTVGASICDCYRDALVLGATGRVKWKRDPVRLGYLDRIDQLGYEVTKLRAENDLLKKQISEKGPA